uniref:Metallothionein n=1 Tax=Meloidogyne floridensis TaxID=298350 RepID=A0A915NBM4_9BILA
MTMHCGGTRCAKDSCRCTCACQFACMGPCAKCRRHQMLRQCLLSKGANICGQCCGHSICESGWSGTKSRRNVTSSRTTSYY